MTLVRTRAALGASEAAQLGGAGTGGEGSLGQPSDSSRALRAKWRRPIRAAWVIRAPGDDCTLTLGWKDGRGLGSGSRSRLRPRREGRAGPCVSLAGVHGRDPASSPAPRRGRQQRRRGAQPVKDLLWLLAVAGGMGPLGLICSSLKVCFECPEEGAPRLLR